MSETRRQLLQLVQDGKITADQAVALLSALEPDEARESSADEPSPSEALVGELIHPTALPPEIDRFRRFWQIPFFIALGFLVLTGLGLRSIYQASAGAITFWFVCLWSLFILAFVLTMLAFLSRRAAWIHVRIKEKTGRHIAISLPLPLGLAGWGLNIARGFTANTQRDKLDTAAAFLAAARANLQEPGADPLIVRIDDDDGDQVEVYIG